MRVLVLNNFFTSWTGSELVALEVAEHFNAVASSFYAEEPMLSSLPDWRPLDRIDISEFDLVWAQHHALFPLLDRMEDGQTRPGIVRVSLSPFEPNERLALTDSYGDEIFANSEETRHVVAPTACTFLNAAPDQFHFQRNFGPLETVLIVSNHPPQELLNAADLLKAEGKRVRLIGSGHESKRVMPDDIRQADVVISIGKTVRYALASGTPTFVYDRFGGDGYLTDQNYGENEYHNFSGRPSMRRLEAVGLVEEILAGYKDWRPPQQPRLSEFLQGIKARPTDFVRDPNLATFAAFSRSLGPWIASALSQKPVEPDPRLFGEAGSWAWLLMCFRKKLMRTPVDIYQKLIGTNRF